MAHFVKIENGIVVDTVVVANEDCGGCDFPESEPIGKGFLASIGLTGEWLQTSYHANFRGRYAGIGFSYDPVLDEFFEPVDPLTSTPTE